MTIRRDETPLSLIVGTSTIHRLREPQRVPQPADPLTHEQRDIAHTMSCTKVGCTRCV